MKKGIVIVTILLILLIVFQLYASMTTKKSETQAYTVIRAEKEFEIRFYPEAVIAKITTTSKSYKELDSFGFSALAKYIFGGNSEKKQIAMTSPVHMDIGDSVSTMAFVMPSNIDKKDLPIPNNTDIVIETTTREYVAVIQFGGFASAERITQYEKKLQQILKDKGITYHGNFRFLGYNPPFQLFGRRNEVIVSLNTDNFK
jgi:hypothetical protein